METYYPIMIVETAKNKIRNIENMLPWKEFGFVISTICDDLEKAVSFFGEYEYKIIFVAISSFGEEDYYVIRQLRRLSNELTIIGISESCDYNTIRHAFKAGCNDVLLKYELRYIQIEEILKEKMNLLNNTMTSDSLSISWRNRLETYLGLIRDKQDIDDKLIYDLITEQQSFNFLEDEYSFIFFRMDDIRAFNRTIRDYDKPRWMTTDEFVDTYQNRLMIRDDIYIHLTNITKDVLKEYPKTELLFTKKHSGLVITPKLSRKEVIILSNKLQEAIYRDLGFDFSIYITHNVKGYQAFVPLYKELVNLISKKFYKGNRCKVIQSEEKDFVYDESLDYNLKETIIPLIMANDKDGCLRQIDIVIKDMAERNLAPTLVKKIFCSLIEDIQSWVHKKKIYLDYPFCEFKQGINEAESILFLRIELDKIIKTLVEKIVEENSKKLSQKVTIITKYIDDHLSEKIALKDIADYIGLSEIHTSRIFKKEVNMRLVEYINVKRIEKAKQLLINTNLKIKDIASRVGIDDQLYFNKIFKKETGLNPRDFRKKN